MKGVIGKPKYRVYDKVHFRDGCAGHIYIVDAFGTFEQNEEPSYDIIIGRGADLCLYKHVRESEILKGTRSSKLGRFYIKKKWEREDRKDRKKLAAARDMAENPSLTYKDIAKKHHIPVKSVKQTAQKYGVKR